MKEYLTKNISGNYQLVNHYSGEDGILVPDGAEALTECIEYGELFRLWWKGEYKICVGYDDDWFNIKRDIEDYLSETKGAVIAWQRESLNDKVASAEVSRQEVFKPGCFEPADNVNNPSHYAGNGVECIDAIQSSMSSESFKGYLKGNVQKYMWRYESKGGLESILKAQWYLNKLIEVKRCEEEKLLED